MNASGDPELDLGLPPVKPKPVRVPVDVRISEKQRWAKYTVVNRKFCDICFDTTPKVGGVPRNVIPRATYTEDGPTGRMWLCARHKTLRETESDLKNASEREKAKKARQKRRKMSR